MRTGGWGRVGGGVEMTFDVSFHSKAILGMIFHEVFQVFQAHPRKFVEAFV